MVCESVLAVKELMYLRNAIVGNPRPSLLVGYQPTSGTRNPEWRAVERPRAPIEPLAGVQESPQGETEKASDDMDRGNSFPEGRGFPAIASIFFLSMFLRISE